MTSINGAAIVTRIISSSLSTTGLGRIQRRTTTSFARTANVASPERSSALREAGIRTSDEAWDPLRSTLFLGDWAARLADIGWTRSQGRASIEGAAKARLEALVRCARGRSPLYRDAYRRVADNRIELRRLPVMTRRRLMARFDEWATDPEISRAGVEAFLADRSRIGCRYRDRYIAWTSSGTTGEPGIYVQDAVAIATYDAMVATQLSSPRLSARCAWGALSRGGRAALIAATGDHFASIASWQRVCRANPWLAARGFSVTAPLPQLVAELNDYQPAFVASYPTTLLLLAEELRAHRLRISPTIVWSGGEYLHAAAERELEQTFGCPVVNEYGASECLSIAFGCGAGWLHVNSDWVLIEAVDTSYEPVAPGEASATVLLTNLANRVQPIIRYDLGDSIVVSPHACACGSALPAIRVEGRRDDVLSLPGPDGKFVCLLPLALTTVVEEALQGHAYQVAQTGVAELSVRLAIDGLAARQAAWRPVSRALRGYLVQQSLPNVRLLLDAQAPVANPRSGKTQQIVAMKMARFTRQLDADQKLRTEDLGP